MKFGEFMASLQKNELKHVYLLAGEEHYYIEKACNPLRLQAFVLCRSDWIRTSGPHVPNCIFARECMGTKRNLFPSNA